jgi:hypothetical protein
MIDGDETHTGEGTQAPGWRAAEEARQLAPRFVHAIYRLIKGCLLHAESNQAVTQLVDFTLQTVDQYCEAHQCDSVSVLFAAKTVFVNRQMLRASRETYELARELGELLDVCGVNEVTVQRTVSRGDVAEFGGLIAGVQRDRSLAEKVTAGALHGIRARLVTGFGAGGTDQTPVQRAARTFAASVLMVRTFFADLKSGKLELPHGIKRIAQKLVTQTEDDARLLVAIAAAPAADSDRASLAVSTAVLSLAMAQQLTTDRTALASLASAALLYDAGRPRLQGSPIGGIERRLNEEEEERVPPSTVVTLSIVGKMHPPSLARTVLAYEALALRGGARPYQGRRSPLVLSRVLATARAFAELRISQGTDSALSIDDAIQVLAGQAQDATERTFVKLLVGALGIFPAGTMVELNTGEMGVVTATPLLPADFARPPVRILYDARANLLEQPLDLDLSRPGPDGVKRLIRRPVDADDQQMKQMRAYVVGLTTAKRRAQSRSIKRPAPPEHYTLPPAYTPTHRPPRHAGSETIQRRPASQRPYSSPPSGPRRGLMEITLNPVGTSTIPAPRRQSAVPPLPPTEPLLREFPADSARTEPPPDPSRIKRERPAVRRRDPRAEEDFEAPLVEVARVGSAAPSPVSARALSQPVEPGPLAPAPFPPAPSAAPPPLRADVPPPLARSGGDENRKQTGSTRQVAWEQYGGLVEKSEPSEEGVLPFATASASPAAPVEETDALLAAYLAEEEGRSGRQKPSTGGLKWGDEKVDSSRPSKPPSTGGLRWGEPKSAPGGGSSGGLRWGSEPASVRSSGGLRWGSTTARPKGRAVSDESTADSGESGAPTSQPGLRGSSAGSGDPPDEQS